MKTILMAIAFLGFAQVSFAATVVGTWQGNVSHYVQDQLKETKNSTLQITADQNGNVQVVEGFFGDTVALTLQNGNLYSNGAQVGIMGEDYISFHTFLFHDNNANTDCFVTVTSFVNPQGQLNYFNKLNCENGYYDSLNGMLTK